MGEKLLIIRDERPEVKMRQKLYNSASSMPTRRQTTNTQMA